MREKRTIGMPTVRRRSSFPLWITGTVILAAIGLAALPAPKSKAAKAGRRNESAPKERPASRADGAQRRHALEMGRGRHATAPWRIPLAGWKDILLRTYQQIGEDRLLAVAAGVVFYGLLALFPAITALVSSYGLFAKASTISEHLAFLAALLPGGAYDLVQEQILRIVEKSDGKLSFAFLLGLGIAIWSANAGMKAMIDALNVIYGETEKRGFIRLNLVSLALTVGGLLMLLIAIGSVVVFPLAMAWIGFDGFAQSVATFLRWPVSLLAIALLLAVLYRVGPSRREARWQWLSVGSVVAALAWFAGSAAFSFYLSHFADYNATYGSLGAAIGLMMWLWLSIICILAGAELNSEIEHQTAADSTVGGNKPLGARDARMADTVGAAQD